MGRKKIIAWSSVIAIAAISIAGACYTRFAFERRFAREVEAARVPPAAIAQNPALADFSQLGIFEPAKCCGISLG